jgi:hypothetical protein
MKENMHVEEPVIQLLTHSSAIFSNRQFGTNSPALRSRHLRAIAIYAQSPST